MIDRYYFEINTTPNGNRRIRFYGNLYAGENETEIELYNGAYFDLDRIDPTKWDQDEARDFFYHYIEDTFNPENRGKSAEDYFSPDTKEISLSEISSAQDGEYYVDFYKV